MEAALRAVYEIVTGEPLEEHLEFHDARGFDRIREAVIPMGDLNVKVAMVHGLSNVQKMLELVRAGKADYHFIEVMSCPGDCIGGGGNPPTTKNWRPDGKQFTEKIAIFLSEYQNDL